MRSRVEERIVEARALARELLQLRREMLELAQHNQYRIERLDPDFRESGQNLLHYLSLRQHDLRPLQARLAALGLSSLGRAESHALSTIDNVLQTLCALSGESLEAVPASGGLAHEDGQSFLARHTVELLDRGPKHRNVRIMVTMPTEAADDYSFVHDLLARGMDCMRINCAHDGPPEWTRMIAHLARAKAALNRECRVQMDLSGPKLRTGPLPPELAVLRIRPKRDQLGRVTRPARAWLTSSEAVQIPRQAADAVVPVPTAWLQRLAVGDTIDFVDARGSRRQWRVVDVEPDGAWVTAVKTAYLVPGITLKLLGARKSVATVCELPVNEGAITLGPDDVLILTRDLMPGGPLSTNADGTEVTPASIGCTLPAVFHDVKVGQSILFDDGRIAGVIQSVRPEQLAVKITRTRPGGSKLKADKGINLPDTDLNLSALTGKDLDDLAFAVQHADIVGLSFTNSAKDVELLHQHIAALGDKRPGIVLKIETRRGFDNLPSILLAAMRSHSCGIMIARGDLAVECGFVRLAEAQEEILWLCEAAHVPVIWATQVLESLAKEGMPSRAEITDAAMADRAECVMLNKGPHILTAVEVLDDILSRMQSHQTKKQSMLRELKVAHRVTRH